MDEKPLTPYDPDIHGELPQRYIDCTKGNLEESQRRWVATLEWRASFAGGLDHLLEHPPDEFQDIKACYPHYVHGVSKNGNYVYIERPGLADFKVLFENHMMDDILEYYVYVTEWIWAVLDTRVDGKVVSIFDCTGSSASSLYGDRLKLLKMTMGTISAHYPERSDKLFIINAPFWFSTIWRVISPMVDPITRTKISILGTNYQSTLIDYLGADQLPTCFGGSDPNPLGESPMEKQLLAYVVERQTKNRKLKQEKNGRSAKQQAGVCEAAERSSSSSVSDHDSSSSSSSAAASATDTTSDEGARRRRGSTTPPPSDSPPRRPQPYGAPASCTPSSPLASPPSSSLGLNRSRGGGGNDGTGSVGDWSFDPDEESLLGSGEEEEPGGEQEDDDDDDDQEEEVEDEDAYATATEDCDDGSSGGGGTGSGGGSASSSGRSGGAGAGGGGGAEKAARKAEEEARRGAELAHLMKRVEETTKACEKHQAKALGEALKLRAECKRKVDELRGRRSGLTQQMVCVINADAAAHGTHPPASSPASSPHPGSSPGKRSSSARGKEAEAPPPAGSGGGGSAVSSLALTFQLTRIKKEAEKLCAKERSAVAALAAAEKGASSAEVEQARLQAEKEASSDALCAAFAEMAS